MPELLDKWLQTTTEPEPTTDLLSGWLATTEPELEEEPTWWGEAWEKVKDFGKWLYPKGWESVTDLPRQYGAAIEKGGMAAGEAMTWLTRLLPGNEDRKSYAEQTTAEKAWTVTQAGAIAGAVATAVFMGIDTVKGLKTYLKGTELQKGYKEVPYTKEMVAKGKPPKIRPTPVYKTGALKGKPIPGARASILRPGVEVTRVVKPAKPEVAIEALKQLSQKVKVIETIKKSDIIDDFTLAIKQALTAKTVGTQATQTAITNAAQTITNDITAVIPAQFSGEFAVSLVNEAIGKLDLAANIISTGMEYTEPKYTRPIEEEIVEKELAKPLEEVSPYGEKFVAPKPEARPTILPEIAPKFVEVERRGRKFTVAQIDIPEATMPLREAKFTSIDYRSPKRADVMKAEQVTLELAEKMNLPHPKEWNIEFSNKKAWIESAEWVGKTMITAPEIAPKKKLPPSMEQEVSMGGGPILGAGMELTAEKPFEVKERGAFKKAIDDAVKTISVYTRIKKENPEAYQHFREFKGGQQLALINAKKITYETWGEINRGEAMAIQRAVQIPKLASKLPENLREPYTKVKDILEDRKQQLIDMGKMTVGWPQSYIAKLDKEKEKLLEDIASLKQPGAIAKRQSRIIEIDELTKVLSKREFFPADYLTKPETQPQILKLLPENKWRNSQLRSKFRAGKFVPDIDTAIKWGLQPVDARASFMDYMTWFEEQKNTYILYQGLKDIPDAIMKPTKNNPPPQDWKKVIGISELEGYYASPFIEDVLVEFNTRDKRIGLEKAYMQVARWGKMASFYNPIIMGGVYDPQQGYMAAGLRALNPIAYVKSIKSVQAGDEFYKQCVAADLFPKPVDLGPEKNMDKLILSVAKQMDKDVPKVTKLIEEWTNGEWNFKGKSNTRKMLDGIKGLYSAEWNLTWGLDAASRMTTVKALLAQGWEFNDAVERARFYHADYGDLPGATRRFANYFMWTPSYQAAMAKVYTNMVAHPIKEKGPLLRWIGFWLLVGTGMSMAGYKFDRYRWTKDKKDGMQDVIMMPGPLAWPFKMILRDPVLGAYWQSSVPANIFLSWLKNYDGLGEQVYDPKASTAVQWGQKAWFAIQRFFRPLEATTRLTDTERSITDRLMSLVAAMKYQRKKPKEKKKEPERWWEK